ncbi:glycerophosphodiester phosphodiesterase family protein [Fundicoccus culcitae]|uniref:Glycerophosphodiester phosphodiesterase n=1 Tax=Fundicoccus culcitae TaxID=2969821 RepID=A0ABY5P689_9LACT|nr:glycerophosphodiester phosphodiesterase family protein [Fundicoccus culcitae]UUX34256.1 glycerophosphodiester phosphodiesterase [Fundicoccus culcitae]
MVKIYAHRGNKSEFAENSLEAFQSALQLGVAGIELDVHLSKDNHLMVIHDETIDRTTNHRGRIKDLTLSQLKEVRLLNPDQSESNNPIPTLNEVFDLLQSHKFSGELNIELKTDQIEYPNIEKRVVDLVEAQTLGFEVIYSSFNWKSIQRIKAIKSDANVALLMVKYLLDNFYDQIDSLQPHALHVDYRLVPSLPQALINKYPLRIWTVNGQSNLTQQLFHSPVELEAIMTDEPFMALELIRLHNQSV